MTDRHCIASDFQRRVALAHRLADAASRITSISFFAPDMPVRDKGGDRYDPVTDADLAAETAIRDLLRSQVPQDAILGEEFGAGGGSSSEWTWTIDPIDGTRAFIVGAPTWTTLIGLSRGENRVFGLIDQPVVGMRWWGDGRSGWQRGRDGQDRPLACRALPHRHQERRMATTDCLLFNAAERDAFEQLRSHVGLVRYGLDGYGIAMLACGRLDLVIEASLAAHDVEALIPVVEGAGGLITDWHGRRPGTGGRIVAAGDGAGLELALDLIGVETLGQGIDRES